jgi:ribA/ribD-fused uncharacterized protein
MPAPTSPRVYGFFGRYAFLSNFHPSPIVVDGITYPTVEHAFAAAKTHNTEIKGRIAQASSPGDAKKLGRGLQLRSDWEAVKDGIMLDLVRRKFAAHPELAAQLLDTDDAELIEANYWNDRYWGVDSKTGAGRNQLGKTLMIVRDKIGV